MLVAASLLCLVSTGFAATATVCRSPVQKMNELSGTASLGDKTVFKCDNGMTETIPGFYKKGWQIGQMHPSVAEDPAIASTFTLLVMVFDGSNVKQ